MQRKSITQVVVVLIATTLVGCSTGQDREVEYGKLEGPHPWTKSTADYSDDTVRFAIFSDLTGGERQGVFEVAIEQLNLLRPELIVNVGDLIDGSTDPEELNQQWNDFDSRARKARAPVFYTGGNHDLMGEAMRRTWTDRLGPRYYYFRYRNVLFLVLDTEDHSSERLREIADLRKEALQIAVEKGRLAARQSEYANLPEDEAGMISKDQADYFAQVLADNQDVRWTFLLMHKAPWANEDMRTWTIIEQALGDRPYTSFNGHRHAYKYLQRNGRDHIQLATTGGVFQSEFGSAFDQIVWVTVSGSGVEIVNLKMSGILDKTGEVPLNGGEKCLEWIDCQE